MSNTEIALWVVLGLILILCGMTAYMVWKMQLLIRADMAKLTPGHTGPAGPTGPTGHTGHTGHTNTGHSNTGHPDVAAGQLRLEHGPLLNEAAADHASPRSDSGSDTELDPLNTAFVVTPVRLSTLV